MKWLTQRRGSDAIAPLAVTVGLLATLVSALGSWIPSLWGDEAASAMSASRSIPSLFGMLGHVDAVHGTYYLGLHLWTGLFGVSPFALRLPSAIAVGFVVAGVVVLASRLADRQTAVMAAIVTIVLPRVMYMGEEARSYAFSAAIVTWLCVVIAELMKRDGERRPLWIAYAALLTLGIYVFLYVALLAIAHALFVLLTLGRSGRRRRILLGLGVTSAIAVFLALPVEIAAYLQRDQIAYLEKTPQASPTTIITSLWFGQNWFATIAWGLMFVAVIVAFVRWRRQGASRTPLLARGGRLSLALLAALWLLVPTILLIGSQFVAHAFTARYLSMCAPAAAILMAVSIRELTRVSAVLRVTAITAIVALAVPIWVSQREPFAKNNSDWAQLSANLGRVSRPGDAVVFDETVRPSRRPRLAMHTYPAGFANLTDVGIRVPYAVNTTWFDRAWWVPEVIAQGRLNGVTRVWLVEYSLGGHTDVYGKADLEEAGFRVTSTIDDHSSVIYEMVRPRAHAAG